MPACSSTGNPLIYANYVKRSFKPEDFPVSCSSSLPVYQNLLLTIHRLYPHSYSITAAASVYVSMTALGKADPYSKALARHSSYQLEAVLPCAAALVELMVKAPTNTLTAVYKKYSSTKFAEVSIVHHCTAIADHLWHQSLNDVSSSAFLDLPSLLSLILFCSQTCLRSQRPQRQR